jgi:DNA-binding NarL/FixJ family response regulator
VSSRENNLKILNDNECEILKNLSKGMSNREIANAMHMSEKTIRNYLSIIYEKIKVKNRTEAVLYYQKNIK